MYLKTINIKIYISNNVLERTSHVTHRLRMRPNRFVTHRLSAQGCARGPVYSDAFQHCTFSSKISVSRLYEHYVTLPGWLYRAIRNENVPCAIFPERAAIGLCWFEVFCEPRVHGERGDRFCPRCAHRGLQYYPTGIIIKYVETKLVDRNNILCSALARSDHYCAYCRKTLYAVRDNRNNEYRNVFDCIREIRFQHVDIVADIQNEENDSGVEC